MKSEPFAGTHTVKDHVGRDFEQYDAQAEHLLADVELILTDANIFHEVVRDGISHVATIELFSIVSSCLVGRRGQGVIRRQKNPKVNKGMIKKSSLGVL